MWRILSSKGDMLAHGETEGQAWISALAWTETDGVKFIRIVNELRRLGVRAIETRVKEGL